MTKIQKLTEKAEGYNNQCGDIMQDLIDEGYLRRDIIAGLNHCAELETMESGDEVILFINGILWERKKIKHD